MIFFVALANYTGPSIVQQPATKQCSSFYHSVLRWTATNSFPASDSLWNQLMLLWFSGLKAILLTEQ